jgi:O-antigen/teichoic acid export membrane protein
MISKKFLKTSLIYTITGALPVASPILLIPFYTENLSNAQFGHLGFYIGFSQLIQILVTFSFDQVIASNFFEFRNDSKKLNTYLSSVIVMVILTGLALLAILLIFGPLLFRIAYSSDAMTFYPYGLISVFTGIFNSVFKIVTNLYIAQQKPDKFGFANVLNFVLIIVFSITGLYIFPNTLIGPMYGRFIAGMVSFSIIFFATVSTHGITFDFKFLKSTLTFNKALFLVSVVSWFVANIDRYIIDHLMNDSDVGIFDFAVRTTIGIEVVMGALLNTVIAPVYSIWSANNNVVSSTPEVNRYYNVITSVAILLIGASIVSLPLILPFIIRNKEYYASFEYMPLLCLSYIAMAIWHMYALPLMFEKRGFVFTKILSASAVFKLISGLILIYFFGLYGAVWSVFLTKLFHYGWVAIESHKIYHPKYNRVKILLLPALYSLIVIISNQLLPNKLEILFHTTGLFIFGIIIFIVFKNEITIVLKKYGLKF